MAPPIDTLVAAAGRGGQPVWLVHGDLVLAEPAAARVAEALATAGGCAVETHRRPAALAPLLDDLRTYSLFAAAKVVLATDSAVFADKNAAGDLIDAAREVLPLDIGGAGGRSLSPREREAASRLLQALHLFDVDPSRGTAEEALSRLPDAALEGGGGKGRRGKGKAAEARAALAELLEAARREGLQGRGESDLAALADAVRDGLPTGHALVLAEREVAAGHPLVALLEERGTVARVGEVEATRRGGFQGLDLIGRQLAEETGVAIAPDALAELARRTLRQEGDWRRSGRGEDETKSIGADSTARFAGEYRKLANIFRGAGPAGGRIERELVEESVDDRGEEDVWQLLDAIAEGRGGEALGRLRRYLGAAEDETSARLAFFGLFAGFCRQLTAVRGLMRLAGVPAGESNYGRFKARHAPALQAGLPTGGKNPVAGLHPYRLHRVYMAASRLPEPFLATLPADVLETELQIKGESGEADAALAGLVARVATAGRSRTGGRRADAERP